MLLNCGAGEDPWESLGLQGDPTTSILKEISPEYSLEGLMLKLKLQYFGHVMWRTDLFGKDPDAGKDWRWEEKRMPKDEMVAWHHRLNGHEFEYTLGIGDGQGGLACCSPWRCKESDTIEWLNWTELPLMIFLSPVMSDSSFLISLSSVKIYVSGEYNSIVYL